MSMISKGFDPNRSFEYAYNCIDYALGNPDARKVFRECKENGLKEPEAFEKTCDLLNISCSKVNVNNVDDFTGKYLICIYWWKQKDTKFDYDYNEYHVVRKNPDNIWVHKNGFRDQPCEFPEEELQTLMNFKDKAFFVIK